MLLTVPAKSGVPDNARLVAHAALLLAEQAYANGQSEDAAHLIDVAHRLFGAAFEWPGSGHALSH